MAKKKDSLEEIRDLASSLKGKPVDIESGSRGISFRFKDDQSPEYEVTYYVQKGDKRTTVLKHIHQRRGDNRGGYWASSRIAKSRIPLQEMKSKIKYYATKKNNGEFSMPKAKKPKKI